METGVRPDCRPYVGSADSANWLSPPGLRQDGSGTEPGQFNHKEILKPTIKHPTSNLFRNSAVQGTARNSPSCRGQPLCSKYKDPHSYRRRFETPQRVRLFSQTLKGGSQSQITRFSFSQWLRCRTPMRDAYPDGFTAYADGDPTAR